VGLAPGVLSPHFSAVRARVCPRAADDRHPFTDHGSS
jgi:hypothetical protein